jgi:hypothetical protein
MAIHRPEFRQPSGFSKQARREEKKNKRGTQQKQAQKSLRLFYDLVKQKSNIKKILEMLNPKTDIVKNHKNTRELRERLF